MSLGPSLLARDQFAPVNESGARGTVWSQWVQVGLALFPATAVVYLHTQVAVASGLLTATSILTGLTFTMAMRFWERSIDARSDPRYLGDGYLLHALDKMRTHLVWTVLVGVVTTGFMALVVIFADNKAPVWVSAFMTFFCMYLVILVGAALYRFYELSYRLRP